MRQAAFGVLGAVVALVACGHRPQANTAQAELEQKNVPFTAAGFAKVVEGNHFGYAQLFLDAGMSPDTRSPAGDPVISLIRHPGGQRFLESLIKAGANVDATDSVGNTPLMRLASWAPFVETLVQNGASLNAQNSEGHAALHVAILGMHVDTVRVLLKAGADPNLRNGLGQTPLIMAVLKGTLSVGPLLKAGADPNLTTDDRYSPLMFAAQSANAGLVRVLLKAGADPNFIGADGATAFSLAKGDITRSMLHGAGATDAIASVESEDP